MGPNQSRNAIPGMPGMGEVGYTHPMPGQKHGNGFFGTLKNFFPSTPTGDVGGSGPVDMTVTGEGCQPISDLGWKKKENKYAGTYSLSERE